MSEWYSASVNLIIIIFLAPWLARSILDLRQQFSKCGPWKLGGYLRHFQEFGEVQIIFIISVRPLPLKKFFFYCIDIRTDGAIAMPGKLAGPLAGSKAAALRCSINHILHCHVCTVEKE